MKGLRLFSLGLVLLTLLSAKAATAQALPTASGPGSFIQVGAGLSSFQTDYGRYHMPGVLVYLDANPHWRWGFEGEARFLRGHNDEQVSESTYLGGVRVLLLPTPHKLNPYAKLLAGAGRITLPFGYAHGGFLAYAPGVGADLSLNDRVNVRVIDLEYQSWPEFPFGSLHPYGVSAGVSFRLNGVSRFPKGTHARH